MFNIPHNMLVRFVHEYGFLVGKRVPSCQVKGPFSVKRAESELHPGPPVSQIVVLLVASGLVLGKNLRTLPEAFPYLWLYLTRKIIPAFHLVHQKWEGDQHTIHRRRS